MDEFERKTDKSREIGDSDNAAGNMNSKMTAINEDEIDLYELWKTLSKYKILIIGFTFFVVLFAGIYAFTAVKWYKTQVTLSIGKESIQTKTGNIVSRYFLNTVRLKHVLDIKYDTSGKYRKKGAFAYISKVISSGRKNVTGLITITAYGKSNKEAVAMIEKPISYVMNKDKVYFNSIIFKRKRKIVSLLRQINFIHNIQIPSLNANMQKYKSDIAYEEKFIYQLRRHVPEISKKDFALAVITDTRISNLRNKIINLSKEIINYKYQIKKITDITIPNLNVIVSNIQASIKPPYIIRTAIIGKIYTKDRPSKPNKKIIIAVAGISALLLGIFLAFFLEFIKSSKNRHKTGQ